MKRILLITAIFCAALPVFSQTKSADITVKGIVIDSVTNKNLDFVTIAIQDPLTKLSVKSTLSKADGSFELNVPSGKKYYLILASIGYNNKILPLNVNDKAINLGRILFSSSSNELKEIQVTTVKPILKQEVDRISYDVQADPESKAVTALDMMRKVPLLTVDAEDAIKLKGSGSYKILINGRESALMAKNPSDILKSMPATNIQKIEVITTPPAKYDAEGLAGIINIITKTSADQGYKIGLSTRYNTVWGTGMNVNATVKKGKFGYAGFVGFSRQRKNTNLFDNTQTRFAADAADVTVLAQNNADTHIGKYYYTQNELSYEIDTLNLLSASLQLYRNPSNSEANQLSDLFSVNHAILQQYRQKNISSDYYSGYDANLNYQLGFKKSKEQLLTLSYKYSYSPGKSNIDSRYSDLIGSGQQDFLQNNNQGVKEHTIQLDYVQPFAKLTVETGAKAILRNNFSEFTTDTLVSPGIYNRNQLQSSRFDYQQDIYSAYNSYQLKLDNWTAKAGLRLEHTNIAAAFAAGNDLNTNYTNLIPSVSVQRKLKSSSINLGYTQRISRPGIYTLNPFINNSNPLFISTGNPDLKAELSNSFELSYSNFSKGAINMGLSYAFSNNSIQNVTSYRDTTIAGVNQKITSTTYQNIGTNKTLGFNINTNLQLSKMLSLSLNGQISEVWLEGFYNGQLYSNNGYIGNAFTNIGYRFGNSGYRAGVNAGYYSGSVLLQGKSKYFISNAYSVTKELLHKTASIALVANNPYSKYWNRTSETNTPDFAQITNYNQFYRNFAVRLDYKFGRLSGEIRKNQRGINNDDASSVGKSSGNG